jgi:hypothetical protein
LTLSVARGERKKKTFEGEKFSLLKSFQKVEEQIASFCPIIYTALQLKVTAVFFLFLSVGSNPTVASYNASVVKIYNATK